MEFYNQQFDLTASDIVRWSHQEFEKCTFKNLNFTGESFAGSSFINCRFDACILTSISLEGTKLDDVVFSGSNLSSVNFGQCSSFGFHVDFQESKLDYASFLARNLKKTRFIDCSLREARFMSCDLTGAVFKNCNLELTIFASNILAQVDFLTSYNLSLDPDNNKLKKTKFSLHSLPGLLTKYDILIS